MWIPQQYLQHQIRVQIDWNKQRERQPMQMDSFPAVAVHSLETDEVDHCNTITLFILLRYNYDIIGRNFVFNEIDKIPIILRMTELSILHRPLREPIKAQRWLNSFQTRSMSSRLTSTLIRSTDPKWNQTTRMDEPFQISSRHNGSIHIRCTSQWRR